MPVILLERLPLPSLKTYTSISVGLFACALYYAIQIVHDRRAEAEEARKNLTQPINGTTLNENQTSAIDTGQSFTEHLVNVLLDETWCIWTLINMAYCCFILFGKVIQGAVFGELRVSEQQHIKDKFWNFVFYKFIFIFGVMNVQHMDEVMMWAAWFSVLGFLHLLSQLCKDRFEYLSFSPTTPGWIHAKVLMLLVAIILMVGALSVVCCMLGFYAGINTFAFMFAECAILGIKCIYVMVRYAIHLWDLNHDGVWENRSLFVYWSEFTCEITSLAIDFVHHLHMLIWSNIFLSMASLVICMQLRYLFHEGQRRLKRHKNYLRVVKTMQASFKMATGDEIDQNNDDCAICWDKMESARRLPCGHLFHDSCLRSWLEQDTSCPTCRMSLSEPMEGEEGGRETGANLPGPPGVGTPIPGPHHHQPVNHFFHFDGSRYVSWLPSFSVEVTHSTPILGNGPRPTQLQTSQLDNMTRDVLSVFPSMPLNVIMEDLRLTRSVELTIENILEGHLVAPPTFQGRTPSSNTLNNNQNEANPQPQTSASGGGDGPDTSTDHLPEQTPPSCDPAPASMGAGDSLPIFMSSNNNINFIHDESVPDLSSESDSELNGDADRAAASPLASVSGYRFSKSSREREEMLMQRKHQLLEHARKKYFVQSAQTYENDLEHSSEDDFSSSLDVLCNAVSRNELSQPSPSGFPHSTNLSDDHRTRRELAYRAAQRRITDTNI